MSEKRQIKWQGQGQNKLIRGFAEIEISSLSDHPSSEHWALARGLSNIAIVKSSSRDASIHPGRDLSKALLDLASRLPIAQVENGEIASFRIIDSVDAEVTEERDFNGRGFVEKVMMVSSSGVILATKTTPLDHSFSKSDIRQGYLRLAAAKLMESLTWYETKWDLPPIIFPKSKVEMAVFLLLEHLSPHSRPVFDDMSVDSKNAYLWESFDISPSIKGVLKIIIFNPLLKGVDIGAFIDEIGITELRECIMIADQSFVQEAHSSHILVVTWQEIKNLAKSKVLGKSVSLFTHSLVGISQDLGMA